jgi:hypothetical protein
MMLLGTQLDSCELRVYVLLYYIYNDQTLYSSCIYFQNATLNS